MALNETLQKTAEQCGFEREDVREKIVGIYKEYLSKDYGLRVEGTKAVQKLSGVPIPEEIVQRTYERLISNGYGHFNLQNIRSLMEVTGYKPRVAPAAVQQGYRSIVSHLSHYGKDNYNTQKDHAAEEWTALEELTGVSVAEEVVQEGYIGLLRHNLEDRVLDCYGSVVWSEYGKAFNWLRERTKIPLGIKVVARIQEMYKYMCEKMKEKHYISDSFLDLIGKTKILPEEGVIQNVYLFMLEKDDEHQLLDLVRVTGIKPSIPADIVQSQYLKHLKRWEGGYVRHIQPLVEATGIRPNFRPKQVQDACRGLLRKGRVEDFSSLIECTGIEPPQDMYKAFLEYLCLPDKKEK